MSCSGSKERKEITYYNYIYLTFFFNIRQNMNVLLITWDLMHFYGT